MAKKPKIPKSAPLMFVLFVIGFTLLVSFFKASFAPEEKMYVKVKLSQGFWWASSTKPDAWFIAGIKEGEAETDVLGNEIAKVVKVTHYPYIPMDRGFEDKYDIYITVELAAKYQGDTKEPVFKRSAISIGSPIELSFPSSQISGTIIDLSQTPFDENLVEKRITLTKRFAYPWEFQAISVGDTYNDGDTDVFRVLTKSQRRTSVLTPNSFGYLGTNTYEETSYITVEALVKAKEKNGQLIFGEDKILTNGNTLSVVTNNLVYDGYVVSSIKD
jgi:hypothetical protein